MNNNKVPANKPLQNEEGKQQPVPDGYPAYPEKDDIYNQFKEEENINPEDLSTLKSVNEADKEDLDNDETGENLDIPGAELDDEQEAIGSEDEENNYYSLGGDNHNDLDEGRG